MKENNDDLENSHELVKYLQNSKFRAERKHEKSDCECVVELNISVYEVGAGEDLEDHEEL